MSCVAIDKSALNSKAKSFEKSATYRWPSGPIVLLNGARFPWAAQSIPPSAKPASEPSAFSM